MTRNPINHYLASHGLATLADPRALFAQLAMGITSHEKFRSVLMRVHPSERSNCYAAIYPNLRFKAKSLGEYESEAKLRAEQHQYLVKDDDAPGGYREFKVPEVFTEKKEPTPSGLKAKMTCWHCTKEGRFAGDTPVQAVIAARKAGWVLDKEKNANLCPKCAKKRGLAPVIQ